MAVHDIRMHIPLVARNQDDPEVMYEHQEYPKMMLTVCDQKYLDAWLERNHVEDERGKKSYRGGRPRVGSPVPILDDDFKGALVNDPDEEEEFRALHPEAIVQRSGPPADQNEVMRLEADNRAKETELVELRARLAAQTEKFAGTTEGRDAAMQAAADKMAVGSGVKGMIAPDNKALKLPKDLK